MVGVISCPTHLASIRGWEHRLYGLEYGRFRVRGPTANGYTSNDIILVVSGKCSLVLHREVYGNSVSSF